MKKRGGYVAGTTEDGERFVTRYNEGKPGQTMRGAEAEAFLRKQDRLVALLGIVLLPVILPLRAVMLLHEVTGWILERIMGGRK